MDDDDLSQDHAVDEEFLAEVVAALAEQRAVPRSVLEAGYAAYSWRTVDAELAELLYDSAYAEPATAGSRSDHATVRAITFASDQLTIELEIQGDDLMGQVVPTLTGEVSVVVDGRPGQRVDVVQDGRFRIPDIPRQPFRLRFEGADGTTVLTGQITV